MSDSNTILSVRSASKIYQMGEVEVAALRDASIDVREGEFLVVAGPSGSGKSTLLNLIGGMDRPTSGEVVYFGGGGGHVERDLAQLRDRDLTRYRRREIGFVFQFFNLVPTLTARENIQVATEVSPDPLDPNEVLGMVGLGDRGDSFPSQLSGGEQQRISIARAVAGNPRLLLCDEPTGALDTETSRQVLAILVDLNERLGKTLIVITHDTAILPAADRTARIHDGEIVSVDENPERVSVQDLDW